MTDAKITVTLLGGVEVSGIDTPLSSRALALLGYLVTRAGSPQPRAHLAGLLWPDSDAAQARTNLRRELHHLRVAFEETGCLQVRQDALAWHDGPGATVDVRLFHSAREAALAALRAQRRPGFESACERALAHYRGPFLPGCYDDWALASREELGRAVVDLCDRGVAFAVASGDPVPGLDLARRRVLLEPLEESGYRQLIGLQRAVGDRAGALRTYHRCASLLEQELGVAVSEATRRELDLLLADGSPGEQRPGTTSWPAAPGLVGRDPERTRLLDAWSAAQSGCRFVVVTGEAGAGKTRLVADLAGTVRRLGGVVATARCFTASGGVPFAPVAEWLRAPQLRTAAHLLAPVWRAELRRLVPDSDVTGDRFDTARAKVDAWQRLRFFEGLARAVLAVDAPLLLTLDDLQWSDKATLAWLSFLVSFARSAPLLVVGTAREEELVTQDLADRLQAMSRAGDVEKLTLGPLSAPDAERLAGEVAVRPLGADELALVSSVAAGNPFYVIESMREVTSASGPLLAADLRGVLAARLARLSADAQQVVSLASAVGRDFALDLLTEAADLDPDTVVRMVDELWRQRILDQREHGYDFTHDLLREAAYDAVPPARRWLLHRRLAQALELLYPDRLDEIAAGLAEQYDRSGQPERALPFYERAARQAGSVFAHAEAVRLWQRCLDLLATLPASRSRDERELAVLEQLLPPMNAWRGYASKDLEGFERRSHRLGVRLGLAHVQATAAIALFTTTFVQGHIVESHRWGAQALALSEQCPDLAAQAHLAFAGSGLAMGRVEEAGRHFSSACALAGETDSLPIGTRTEVHALGWWAHARWLAGDPAGSQATCEQANQVARRIDHPYSLAVALSYAAITHQMRGDLEALEQVLDELTRLCERYGFAYYRDWAVVLTGWLQGGRDGLRLARKGIARLRVEGSLARMPYWLWLVADLHRRAGNQPAACAVLDAAQSFAVQHDDVWWLPQVRKARDALAPGTAVLRG